MFYVASQFAGGLIGAFSAAVALSAWASHPAVNYVVTMPRNDGALAALIAEITIAFILMTVVLNVSSTPTLHKFTGLCAGILVAIYITVEAPISGMSMNPARTFASAVPAHYWAGASLDLFRWSANRHGGGGGRGLSPNVGLDYPALRQAPSRKYPALYFLRQTGCCIKLYRRSEGSF